MRDVRTGILRGREHLELGAVAAISEGAAAVTISKGGASKTYAHVDPNEDAAAFAIGSGGLLAVVADGHNGATASELAVEFLMTECAPRWTSSEPPCNSDEQWRVVALRTIEDINRQILQQARERNEPAANSTLSVALVRPGEDRLWIVSIGDSHIYTVSGGVASDRGWATRPHSETRPNRTYYLGYGVPKKLELPDICVISGGSLQETSAVALCTDGLSEKGIGVDEPATAIEEAVSETMHEPSHLRALEVSKAIARTALHAQKSNAAGDNIACAVLWLGD